MVKGHLIFSSMKGVTIFVFLAVITVYLISDQKLFMYFNIMYIIQPQGN